MQDDPQPSDSYIESDANEPYRDRDDYESGMSQRLSRSRY